MDTDVADHLARLDVVTDSTRAGKAQLEGMSKEVMIAYSVLLLSPLTMQSTLASANVPSPVPVAFNLIVSNMPGPRDVRTSEAVGSKGCLRCPPPCTASAST